MCICTHLCIYCKIRKKTKKGFLSCFIFFRNVSTWKLWCSCVLCLFTTVFKKRIVSTHKKLNEMNRNTFSLLFKINKYYAFITIIIAQEFKREMKRERERKEHLFMIFIQIYFFYIQYPIYFIILYFVGSGHSFFMGQA